MSVNAESEQGIDRVIARIQDAGVDTRSIEGMLMAVLESGDSGTLRAWAREQGEEQARSGEPVRELVARIMSIASALDSALPGGDELSNMLVSEAVEGYMTASGTSPSARALSRQMRERLAELTALHRINSAANSSLKLTDMLNEISQAVVAVTHADVCSIFLYEQEWDQLVLTASTGLSQESVGKIRLQMGEGITGWAALLGKPVSVKDAWSDPRFKYVPALQEEQTVSILAVPIVLFTKEKLVGVIDVHTFQESDFSDNEIKFLETVAGEVAIAIENARLYEQTDSALHQKVTELSTLQGVSAHIAATLNLTEVLSLIAHEAAHLVRADAATIYELHDEAGVLEMVAQYDLQSPIHNIFEWKAGPRTSVPIEQSAIARTVERGLPVPMDPDADAGLGVPFASDGYLSLFCVPLVAPRSIMGGICLYNREAKTFSEEQVRLLDAFAHEAAIALENSRLYDAALRGLQTKSAMLQEMNHRVRNNLQTVAGLLSMQLRRMAQEGEGAVAVRESIARVQSIAAVHDLMMLGDVDIESISLYDLARKITDAVVSTLSSPGFKLKIDIDHQPAERIRVGSHEATLLALLFNELVSNAILHGFAGQKHGEISIRVFQDSLGEETASENRSRTSPGPIRIEVEDTGVGLPEGFDPQVSGNLGLNIVRTLVANDLQGTFRIQPGERGRGTKATFSFMLQDYSSVAA
jgi:two-component sensor histidine kinase/putative methionine-R-sulfoxide reductase with GAF domain